MQARPALCQRNVEGKPFFWKVKFENESVKTGLPYFLYVRVDQSEFFEYQLDFFPVK